MALLQESAALEFKRGFSIDDPSFRDSDQALYKRFLAASNLSQALDYLSEYDRPVGMKVPDLGALNTRFDVFASGIERIFDIAPMGATDEILLGCFSLAVLHPLFHPPRRKDGINLFGAHVTTGVSTVGYTGLERRSVSAAGFGVMKYTGKIAIFDCAPGDDELIEFASSVVESRDGHQNLGLSRIDLCVEPALRPLNQA